MRQVLKAGLDLNWGSAGLFIQLPPGTELLDKVPGLYPPPRGGPWHRPRFPGRTKVSSFNTPSFNKACVSLVSVYPPSVRPDHVR